MANDRTKRKSRSKPVLVYTVATRSVSLEPIEVVESRSGRCLEHGGISRNPFRNEQRIQVPSLRGSYSTSFDDASSRCSEDLKYFEKHLPVGYSPTLVFNNIAPNMRWRRLVGNRMEWQVYEDPVVYSITTTEGY